jgi:L-ascorbate metabolism protein UlaG (beta-lactamase superfamily)
LIHGEHIKLSIPHLAPCIPPIASHGGLQIADCWRKEQAMHLNGIKITWLGHATFRVETPGGKTVLIDPWVMGNPKCPDNEKNVKKVDILLCTHGHFDHIGDAVEIAKKHNPKVVGIPELCGWLAKKGVKNTAEMNKGGTQQVEDIKVTMVHADHSCGITDGDQVVYGGEACGYVVEFANGIRIYHAGDTNVFGDMQIIRELYAPSIVMLPIGDHYTMSPREAAYAVKLLQPTTVIPMHFGTFPVLTGTPGQLQKLVGKIEVHEMKPGETVS